MGCQETSTLFNWRKRGQRLLWKNFELLSAKFQSRWDLTSHIWLGGRKDKVLSFHSYLLRARYRDKCYASRKGCRCFVLQNVFNSVLVFIWSIKAFISWCYDSKADKLLDVKTNESFFLFSLSPNHCHESRDYDDRFRNRGHKQIKRWR